MTGKHRHWHRRWVIDLAACTATHDSGLVVRAVRAPGGGAMDYTAANLDEWQSQMLKTMPITNLVPHAQRLMREAAAAYQHALEQRH